MAAGIAQARRNARYLLRWRSRKRSCSAARRPAPASSPQKMRVTKRKCREDGRRRLVLLEPSRSVLVYRSLILFAGGRVMRADTVLRSTRRSDERRIGDRYARASHVVAAADRITTRSRAARRTYRRRAISCALGPSSRSSAFSPLRIASCLS